MVIDFKRVTGTEGVIDLSKLRERVIDVGGLIGSAEEEVESLGITEHSAEPIKSVEDIERVSRYLIDSRRYRDNMLFIVGINFGLRVSDILRLRFIDIIDEEFRFRNKFSILEKKTSKTRKRKKNRYISINDAVVEAVIKYLENVDGVKLDDYMFRSESNNGSGSGKAMHRASVDVVLKGICKDLGLGIRMSTHTLRKTFAYHQMIMSGNEPRKLLLLQKMFGHSTSAQTLDYIGITEEEIDRAYKDMNLGGVGYSYVCKSEIYESYEVV